ncbi:23S rRNA (adenine(2503)-C(2))-methyltransferase RlmN [Candidatus Bipolaricaulota bacterium]|nr:23S rRNA (adenine(2503)-C(2))-methyltransferase RlmN [Candidatus Bipolaricaulota bacterium]
MNKVHLLDLSLEELIASLAQLNEPAFRATQIWHAAFKDLSTSYAETTTLSKTLKIKLDEVIPWKSSVVLKSLSSSDRQTTKLLLQLDDGETIEAVIMRYARRNTACISTQVGCAMACKLCATGQSGFTRDLTAGEIVDQVLTCARLLRNESQHLSNVVFMGMGEPLANYEATLQAIRILNDPRGFSLGARSFTISTVGIVPGIRRLSQESLQINLAVSLHTADEALRSQLVPINHRYPVAEIVRACRAYVRATHRRVTFEVALIAGVNDSDAHAAQIAEALHGVLCHVNIIPFNPIAGSSWHSSTNERVQAFAHIIESVGYPVTIRQSRGTDIQAGCGQLRADETVNKQL